VWTVSYTVFGMDCTEQDPMTNFRVTNGVIFVTVTGVSGRGNVTSVEFYIQTYHSQFILEGVAEASPRFAKII
jgi:hypothetical protein